MKQHRWTIGVACVATAISFAAPAVAEPNTPNEFPRQPLAGVMDNSAPGDHKVTDAIGEREMAFMDWIRDLRIALQARQASR